MTMNKTRRRKAKSRRREKKQFIGEFRHRVTFRFKKICHCAGDATINIEKGDAIYLCECGGIYTPSPLTSGKHGDVTRFIGHRK